MTFAKNSTRIHLVDALRGFAILSILLLHNIEHFDLYHFPDYLPPWLKTLDSVVWDTLFFLFSGKSYAIFALLFGLTFQLQFSHQQQRGADFRERFAWRLVLLLGFGLVNSLFYQGDILTLYAVLGFALIPVRRLSHRAVLIIALCLMAQPAEWARFFYLLAHPEHGVFPKYSDFYFSQSGAALSSPSFWEAVKGNYTIGKPGVLWWYWEYGRVFQTAPLFMLGMLLGRVHAFDLSPDHRRLWRRALLMSVVLFGVLFGLKQSLPHWMAREALSSSLGIIINSWSNMAFTGVLVSLFVCLYQRAAFEQLFNRLIPIGRMTLTNYIMQSIIGTALYYGYGLGLYRYTGATMSLGLGLVLLTLQLFFCRWWLSTHTQGPLEALWHRATWAGAPHRARGALAPR